jgi:lipopolysaccharide export system permease protein
MKIIDIYIGKQIILAILLVTLALFGLDLFFNLVNELRFSGKGDYTLSKVFLYLLLSAPSKMYSTFPWAALIGAMMCLGNLANHHELVILRVSGVSVLRIAASVLKAALVLLIPVVLLGEVVAPIADEYAQQKRTLALSAGQSIQTKYGLWVKQGHTFIHVQSIRPNGELIGITRYAFNNNRALNEVSFATSATPESEDTWRLLNVSGTRFKGTGTKDAKTEVFRYPELKVSHLLDSDIVKTSTIKHPEYLSLPVLWRTIEQREQNDLQSIPYQIALWTKVFQPMVVLVMVFLAVPFVFGPLRSVNMGFRIVCGIVMAFVFHMLNSLFAPMAVVYSLPPILAVLAPIALFSVIGVGMVNRTP